MVYFGQHNFRLARGALPSFDERENAYETACLEFAWLSLELRKLLLVSALPLAQSFDVAQMGSQEASIY